MGKDLRSWLHQWRLDGHFPSAKSSELPFCQGMANMNIASATPYTNTTPPNCGLPAFGLSALPNFKLGQFGVAHGMFYHLPCSRQGLAPGLTLDEKVLPNLDPPGKVTSCVDDTGIAKGPSQKQFLVFDHTGDKATMIYSTGIDTPSQQLTYFHDASRVESNFSGINMINGFYDNYDINEGNDLREDTEEINALLYSDSEDKCSDDGEETSTGHSPSTMTGYEKQYWSKEDDMDEVASCSEPAKRQKLYVRNGSSFVKPNLSRDYEDDAESSCADGNLVRCNNNRVSLSGSKRHRKEKIFETVSVLETIIPGVKSKNAVMILDEAINYLRLLKTDAISLGLSSQ